MSFCRHLLHRVHASRSLPTPYLYKRPLSDPFHVRHVVQLGVSTVAPESAQAPRESSAVGSVHTEGVSPDIPSQETTSAVVGGSPPRPITGHHAREGGSNHAKQFTKIKTSRNTRSSKSSPREIVITKRHEGTEQAHIQYRAQVQSYKKLREVGGSLATSHTIKEFNQILSLAVQKFDDAVVTKMLAEDVLQAAPKLEVAALASMVGKLLRMLALNRRALSKSHILRLLQTLSAREGGLASLLPASLPLIAKAIIALPPNSELDDPLRELIIPLLTGLIVDPGVETTQQKRAMSEACVWPLYRLALDFAKEGRRERALEIVSVLVKTQNVPASILRPTDMQSGDFRFIVLSAAVRSCMQWGWRSRGTDLMVNGLSSEPLINQYFADLAVLYAAYLLDPPKSQDIQSVASILTQLVDRGPKGCISDRILQDFYDAAIACNSWSLVETVYRRICEHKKYGGHSYPPPTEKENLLKFMRYLSQESKNNHVARMLAAHAVSDEFSPSPSGRAEFITLVAEQGFALSARTLWERWSVGQHRRVFVSSSAMMLRLVSLFDSLAKREETQDEIRQRPLSSASAAEANVVARRSPMADVDTDALLRTDEHVLRGMPAEDRTEDGRSPKSVSGLPPITEGSYAETSQSLLDSPVATVEAAGHFPSPHPARASQESIASQVTTDVISPRPDSEGIVGEDKEAAEHPTAEGFRAFAARVLHEYRSARTLASMTHHDLNAYARACFILSMAPEGFQAFVRLLRKREVPDVQDVNVLLSFLAQYSPANAAKIIDRMVRKGMQPDQVTFGTVIHHAVVHGDTDLVDHLTQQARGLGIEALDLKTVGSLIRAVVTGSYSADVSPWSQLAMVRKLVRSLLDQDLVPSTNMARDCIVAALRADELHAAFWFWSTLLKGKVQWDDEMQVRTRKRIAARVREHQRRLKISGVQAHILLRELREDDGVPRTPSPAKDTD